MRLSLQEAQLCIYNNENTSPQKEALQCCIYSISSYQNCTNFFFFLQNMTTDLCHCLSEEKNATVSQENTQTCIHTTKKNNYYYLSCLSYILSQTVTTMLKDNHRIIKYPELEGPPKDNRSLIPGSA